MGTLLIDFAVNTAAMLAIAWLITRPAFMRRRLVAGIRRIADDIEQDRWVSVSYRGRALVDKGVTR